MKKCIKIFLLILTITLTACKSTSIKNTPLFESKVSYIKSLDGSNKVIIEEKGKKIELLNRIGSKKINFIVKNPINLKPKRIIIYDGKSVLRVNSCNNKIYFEDNSYSKLKSLTNENIEKLSILIKINDEKYLTIKLNKEDLKNIEKLFRDQG